MAKTNSEPQELFPTLPPEIRNMIYTSTLTNQATNTHLPFQQKVYTSSHTTVHIIPTYHGLPSLISLQHLNYREAHEYLSYILQSSAVSLHIAVHFKGNPQTFDQGHWDTKHIAHLQTLLKRFPWLANVINYDVQVHWRPLRLGPGAKVKGHLGLIARRMVEVLTTTLNAALPEKSKKLGEGEVKAGLHIAEYVVKQQAVTDSKMQLWHFLADNPLHPKSKTPKNTTTLRRTQIREVRVAPLAIPSASTTPDLPQGFKPIPLPEDKSLLVLNADGSVHWTPWVTQGDLVYAKTTHRDGKVTVKEASDHPDFKKKSRMVMIFYLVLMRECGTH